MYGEVVYRRFDVVPGLMMVVGVLLGTLLIFTF
jgi:hypothetical protein